MAKMTKKGQGFVSDEISHLIKDGPSKGSQKGKKMPQKQAVAVALDVARRKGFKTPPNPKEEAMSSFDRLVQEMDLPDDRQQEREDRQRRMDQKRGLQVRRGENKGIGSHRMAYRPRKSSLKGLPKKHQRWNETPPEPRQIAKAGAELERKYALVGESTRSLFDFAAPTNPNQREEAMSIFDNIVKQESSKSLFDGIVENDTGKSMFDDIVEDKNAPTKSAFDGIVESTTSTNWDDRVARTMTLAEDLVTIRSSVKKTK